MTSNTIPSRRKDDGELARLKASNADLMAALCEADAFITVMFSSGPDAAIPDRVPTPLGPEVQIGEISQAIRAAIAKARS